MSGRTWRNRRRGPSLGLVACVAGAVVTVLVLLLVFTTGTDGPTPTEQRQELELNWPEDDLQAETSSSGDGAGRLAVELAVAAEPPSGSVDLYLPSLSLVELEEPLFEESRGDEDDYYPVNPTSTAVTEGPPWEGVSEEGREEEAARETALASDSYRLSESGEVEAISEEEVEEGHLLLLHQGRCGSTVLMSLMRQKPNQGVIVWSPWNEFMTETGSGRTYKGEEWDDEWLTRFVSTKTETTAGRVTKNLILSLKFAHICRLGVPVHAVLAALHKAGFRHMVLLHRNYLKVALSMAHVKQKHVAYHAGSQQVESCSDLSLRVGGVAGVSVGSGAIQNSCGREKDEEPLLGSFEVLDRGYRDAVESPHFRDHLLLSYEKDIYEDPLVAYAKLRTYLARRGLHLVPSEELDDASLAKTTDCSVEEMMEASDYAAVSGRLQETKWAWTLLSVEQLQAHPGFPLNVIHFESSI